MSISNLRACACWRSALGRPAAAAGVRDAQLLAARGGRRPSTIGYLSWVGLAYGFKWAWAPLVDRLPIRCSPACSAAVAPGCCWRRRRSCSHSAAWLSTDPQAALTPIVWFALATAFASATQDIALDAYRIESADADRQAALAATYQTGYRLAMIWSGAGALWLAARASDGSGYQQGAWQVAYLAMAASMLLGIVTVLLSPEPVRRELPPARDLGEWLHGTLVEPFADFLRRYRWQAALILALIAGTGSVMS